MLHYNFKVVTMKWFFSLFLLSLLTLSLHANTTDILKRAKAYYYGTNKINQDYHVAFIYFKKAGEQNSIVAYRYLGSMYLFGHGVRVNKVKAKQWFEKAIFLGDSRSQKIYDTYLKSSDTSNHTTKSRYYKVKGIRSDDTLSVRENAGTMYRKIGDLPFDAINVERLICKKSARGGTWCKIKYQSYKDTIIGWVSEKYLNPFKKRALREKEKEHRQEVKSTAVRLCDKGNYTLCHIAGSEYFNKKQYAKAKKYFLKGCNNNIAISCSMIAKMYDIGTLGYQKEDKILLYYTKACRLNDPEGCLFVASIYLDEEDPSYQKGSWETYYNRGCALYREKLDDYAGLDSYEKVIIEIKSKMKNWSCP